MTGTRAFWAPGRVNLLGEHTDYSGGLVLPAALDLGVRVEGMAGPRIELTSDRAPEPVDLPPDGGDAVGWGRYAAAVAAELAGLGRPAVGFAGTVTGTVPPRAGLSSSAALEVAIATALCAVAGFELEPLVLAETCRRAELRAVGVPCGILDQASAVLGRSDCAVLLDTASLEYRSVPLPAGLALVVVDSGVARSLEETGYAERRRQLEEGVAALGGRTPRDVTPGELDDLELADVPLRRLRHVVTENERVVEAVRVLEEPGTPRLDRLGKLFREGHRSLRDDFEVTTPELDLLVELAYGAGALAARMTGGGFGGSIVALAQPSLAAGLADGVAAGYRARTGRIATARVCRASDGATEL
ncbi:MAG TPA: galactokinase family protein [Gaiella sp.]